MDNKTSKQNTKETKVVNMVLDMFKRSEQAKSKYVDTWKECIRAYEGKDDRKRPSYKSDNVSNYIFSTIETVRPIMMADNPKFQVMPRLEKDFNKSYRVQQGLDYEWTRTKMDSVISKVLLPTLQTGTGIVGLFWNGTSGKIGNIEPKIVSPFNFFPDPACTTLDDADYCIYATYQNVGKLIKQFPEKAEELKMQTKKPDKEDLVFGRDTSNMSSSNVLVLECYMRDYEMVTKQIEEEGNIIEEKGLKYPNGRRIQIAGEVLLSDEENPYEDGKFPFVIFKAYDVPDQFWGVGEVEHIVKPQKNADDLTNQIIDNAKMTANAQWIADKNCGVEEGTITNRPGLILRKNPGSELRRETPPNIPSYVQQTVEMLKRDVEIISGVFDITRGERPASITSGVAIQQLTQSAQSRIKLKMRYLENSLGELGAMWISRIRQFWTLPRQLRIMVSSKDYEQVSNDMMAMGQQFIPQLEQNGVTPIFTTLNGEEIDGDWDVNVVAGSTMPVNKNTRLQMLIQLAQTPAEDGLPMVDRKTLLENSELPNVEEILSRFEQQRQINAEQQAQSQQAMQQEQYANQQMAAELEMQKAQQKHDQTMQMEGMRADKEVNENSKDRELELAKLLTTTMQKKEQEGAKKEDLNKAQEEDSMKDENANNENAKLEELIQYVLSLPQEEQAMILEQYPDLAQIISMYMKGE